MAVSTFTKCPCGTCTPRTIFSSSDVLSIPGVETLNAARALTGRAILVSGQEFAVRNVLPIVGALSRIRTDFKLLAAAGWDRVPGLSDRCIFLDVLNSSGATRAWYSGLRQAVSYLRSGGLLVVFPGEESSQNPALSARWKCALARLITGTGSVTLPVAVNQNGDGTRFMQIGGPIAAAELAGMTARQFAAGARSSRSQTLPARIRTDRLVPRISV